MSLSARVTKNTTILLVGQVTGVLLAFVSSIFLVRALGSVGYGEYAAIYAFLSLFGWLVSFGTDNIIVREAAKSPRQSDSIWSTGILTQAVFSGLTLLVTLATAIFLGYTAATISLMLLAAIEMIMLVPWRFATRVFQVELKQSRGVLATLTRQAVWLLILIGFSFRQGSLPELILARTLVAILEVGVIWWFVQPYLHFHWKLGRSSFTKLVIVSWPLALNALSVSVYHRIDQVMIDRYLGPQDLGYYAVAVNLAGLMSIVPLAFMSSVYPLLCQQERSMHFERITSISFRWLLTGSVGLAGLLMMIGQPLIVFAYGIEFLPSVPILNVLVWSQVAVCYGVVLSQILLSRNLQNYITIATVIGASVNFLGNVLILPRYGVIGSAWVTVGSYAVASIFVFLFFSETRHVGWHGFVVLSKIVFIGVIGLGVSYLLTTGILLMLTFFVVFFAAGLWISKILTGSDLNLLFNALHIRNSSI